MQRELKIFMCNNNKENFFLYQLINANQPMFMRLLQEGMEETGEGSLPLPPSFITNFTREEKEAIDRVKKI